MQTDETTEIFKLEKGIADFQWDPLSQGYCLASMVDGTINLLDFFQKVTLLGCSVLRPWRGAFSTLKGEWATVVA